MTDDLDRIMDIMETAFDPAWGEAWNRRQVTDSLLLPGTHYRLASQQGDPPAGDETAIGFSLSRSVVGEEELLLVAISPELRGRGLGRILLEQTMEDARMRGAEQIFLEMRYNNPAEKLYRAVGFKPIGRRKDYYRLPGGNRIDAITFSCPLRKTTG